jgi:hypothetical protein
LKTEYERDILTDLSRYKAMLLDLQQRLENNGDKERTRELIAQLLGPVRIVRDEHGVTWAGMKNPAEQLFAVGGIESLIVGCGGWI